MDNLIKDLREMCETLARTLHESNEKIRNAGSKVSSTDLDFIDRLTHALKSIKTTVAMMEAEEMDDGSYGDGSYRLRGYSRDGGSYRGSYDSGSYARGRGRYANRDSMGRYSSRDGYSRDGYSGHGDMVEELRGLMDMAPDDATRQEMQRMIQKLEQR